MADRRQIKRSIKQLQRIKTWQLLVLFVIMLFVAATFLRLNNIGMVERRNTVLAADQAGNLTTIQQSLYDLQQYSASHMNAATGNFYLQHQYERDVQQLVTAASKVDDPYGDINATVDKLCRSRFSSYSQAWVQCFASELAKYPPAPDPVDKVNLPDPNLYRYSYVAPLWSPDFAGLSTLICGVILLMIAARLLSLGILRLLLKRHYRGI